jgi:hypothetical protein
MKSKRFEYTVISDSGFMLAGRFCFDKPASIEQAASQAGQEAKSIARDLAKPLIP